MVSTVIPNKLIKNYILKVYYLIVFQVEPLEHEACENNCYSSWYQSIVDTFTLTMNEFNVDFEKINPKSFFVAIGEASFVF